MNNTKNATGKTNSASDSDSDEDFTVLAKELENKKIQHRPVNRFRKVSSKTVPSSFVEGLSTTENNTNNNNVIDSPMDITNNSATRLLPFITPNVDGRTNPKRLRFSEPAQSPNIISPSTVIDQQLSPHEAMQSLPQAI